MRIRSRPTVVVLLVGVGFSVPLVMLGSTCGTETSAVVGVDACEELDSPDVCLAPCCHETPFDAGMRDTSDTGQGDVGSPLEGADSG